MIKTKINKMAFQLMMSQGQVLSLLVCPSIHMQHAHKQSDNWHMVVLITS